MGPRIVTQRDVARHAGVSQTSVSLALRGRTGLSEETRRKVAEAIAATGYRPDPVLASLTERRWARLSGRAAVR